MIQTICVISGTFETDTARIQSCNSRYFWVQMLPGESSHLPVQPHHRFLFKFHCSKIGMTKVKLPIQLNILLYYNIILYVSYYIKSLFITLRCSARCLEIWSLKEIATNLTTQAVSKKMHSLTAGSFCLFKSFYKLCQLNADIIRSLLSLEIIWISGPFSPVYDYYVRISVLKRKCMARLVRYEVYSDQITYYFLLVLEIFSIGGGLLFQQLCAKTVCR